MPVNIALLRQQLFSRLLANIVSDLFGFDARLVQNRLAAQTFCGKRSTLQFRIIVDVLNLLTQIIPLRLFRTRRPDKLVVAAFSRLTQSALQGEVGPCLRVGDVGGGGGAVCRRFWTQSPDRILCGVKALPTSLIIRISGEKGVTFVEVLILLLLILLLLILLYQ